MGFIRIDEQSSTPAAPAAGKLLLYPKTDGNWYVENSSAVESILSSPLITSRDSTTSGSGNNNYALPSGVTEVVFSNASAIVITGFSGGVDARRVLIRNTGATSVQITHNDSGSSAANRVKWPASQGQIIGPGGVLMIDYDATAGNWRGYCVDPGAAISFTPTIISSGGGTPTYNLQQGFYVQTGKKVRVGGRVSISAFNTLLAGNVSIGGIPLTGDTGVGDYHTFLIWWNSFASAMITVLGLMNYAIGTSISMYGITAAATSVATLLTTAALGSTGDMIFSGEYFCN